ncbi:MAG: aldose 1-epimerase [Rhodospirillaceae bacterium]|nr:aldose 1-epimerase [Rhodospirillaceae bacterium]
MPTSSRAISAAWMGSMPGRCAVLPEEHITLHAGALTVTLHPAIGGCLGSFLWQHPDGRQVPLLRTMSAGAANSESAACFPLIPFSNRIRHGRLTFEGRSISLPRNTSGQHVEHGHGWQRPWSLQKVTDLHATIGFTHDPEQDATWPFAYAAEQDVALDKDGLTVTLRARNTGARPMPIGFGLHPYFLRTPLCRLQAIVEGFWETDTEVLPTRHVAVPEAFDLRRGLAMNNVVIDNCFTGFGGQAVIDWPEFDSRLIMTAERPLRFLTLCARCGGCGGGSGGRHRALFLRRARQQYHRRRQSADGRSRPQRAGTGRGDKCQRAIPADRALEVREPSLVAMT